MARYRSGHSGSRGHPHTVSTSDSCFASRIPTDGRQRTITTSADSTTSYTSTTRTITTETVTETATTTVPPVARRAANIAAIAEDVIDSVIESGSAIETSSKSPQRLQAESGLANACSCKMVDPTATVTSSFTVPPIVSPLKTTDCIADAHL
ncbi:hypothetical protein T440DRAFT_150799 [Plenodomus tracheiphilus IPT5]|uniref:Uncharacterized protein n=1 Tax=Plenodomus tracheiphilus IPT5 TaxID=1408161 RepID=A0A6A7B0P5_9PLEO|nr:hypothetical protein T440DRAFT_150799 [Plenodomus tracheiphilus IPT5]